MNAQPLALYCPHCGHALDVAVQRSSIDLANKEEAQIYLMQQRGWTIDLFHNYAVKEFRIGTCRNEACALCYVTLSECNWSKYEAIATLYHGEARYDVRTGKSLRVTA